jgi:hypothetical protein
MSGVEPIGLPDWHTTSPNHTPWEEKEEEDE